MNNFNYTTIKSSENIKLFLLETSSHNLSCIDTTIIPQQQLDEIKKYRNLHDRNKRLLARTFLYSYLKKSHSIYNFTLTYNQYLKPKLYAKFNIDFSFSYSQNYIAIGISYKSNVGVDIEHIDNNLYTPELAVSIMHPCELKHHNNLTNLSQKRDFFFKVFNLKEAIIKAMGYGLHFDILSINTLNLKKKYHQNLLSNKLFFAYYLSPTE